MDITSDIPQVALGGGAVTAALWIIVKGFRERSEITKEWKELYEVERRKRAKDIGERRRRSDRK